MPQNGTKLQNTLWFVPLVILLYLPIAFEEDISRPLFVIVSLGTWLSFLLFPLFMFFCLKHKNIWSFLVVGTACSYLSVYVIFSLIDGSSLAIAISVVVFGFLWIALITIFCFKDRPARKAAGNNTLYDSIFHFSRSLTGILFLLFVISLGPCLLLAFDAELFIAYAEVIKRICLFTGGLFIGGLSFITPPKNKKYSRTDMIAVQLMNVFFVWMSVTMIAYALFDYFHFWGISGITVIIWLPLMWFMFRMLSVLRNSASACDS